MEARYLRVKHWREHQHYGKRKPPWIKLENAIICKPESGFAALNETEQWQLVRIWLFSSRSEVEVPDPEWKEGSKEERRMVPIIAYDERTIRLGIRSTKKVPLEKFIRLGFLIPMREDEIASTLASTLASTKDAEEGNGSPPEITEVSEESFTRAVSELQDPARTSNNVTALGFAIRQTIDQALREAG